MLAQTYRLIRLLAVACFVMLVGCQSNPQQADSLYMSLGEADGIDRIVNAFFVRLAEDPIVVETFGDTDMDVFYQHLSDQLCQLSGGGFTYEGRNMAHAHKGLSIAPNQFNALVEDLMQAMDDVGTPIGAQNRLLKLLAPTYRDVVERGAKRNTGDSQNLAHHH